MSKRMHINNVVDIEIGKDKIVFWNDYPKKVAEFPRKALGELDVDGARVTISKDGAKIKFPKPVDCEYQYYESTGVYYFTCWLED